MVLSLRSAMVRRNQVDHTLPGTKVKKRRKRIPTERGKRKAFGLGPDTVEKEDNAK